MRLTIPQCGLLVLVAVAATAFVTHRITPSGLPTNVSTSPPLGEEVGVIRADLTRAKRQHAIVAELEDRHYHITYDYLSTPSSDPAPAVKRLVDTYGRDFVGAPFYIGNSFSPADVELISQLPSIQIVDFDDTGVTDEDLLHLKGLPRLRVLFLNSTSISNAGLQHLIDTPLEILHLQNCSHIDDDCIPVLSRMQSLKELYISIRNFSPAGIQQLKAALPNCKID
jgi:hypothetical protein